MSEPHPLQQLYDAEVNFSITTFFDAGFVVRLGDSPNGFKAETTRKTFDEAVKWLVEQADKHFPGRA